MPELSLQTKAQRLRIYIGESDRWRGKPLDVALLESLHAQGLAGATLFRGTAGFGAHSRIHTSAIEVLSVDLPIVIEVVDAPEKISSAIDSVYPMVREGLITLEDVQIVKYTHRYLNPLPADKLVSEVMTREVVSISMNKTIADAWKLMLDKRLKAVPVVDPSGGVVGILTDEDLLERAGLRQRLSVAIRLDQTDIEQELHNLENNPRRIEEVMSRPVVSIAESETLGAAAAKMVKSNLKRLPVVNVAGRLVGMLSRLDVLREVAHTGPAGQTRELVRLPAGKLVKDIMVSDIPMVNQDEDLTMIIEKFAHSDSHRLIVVDSAGKAIGLLSDSDVVARVQPARRRSILEALRQVGKPAPGKETAFDLMSPGPLTASPDLSIVNAIKLMLSQSRKWLVVVDENGRPLGLVDRQILLEAVSQ